MKCQKCGGESFRKKGVYDSSKGTFQIWQCKGKGCAKCVIGEKI